MEHPDAKLTLDQKERIDKLADKFEKAFRENLSPQIEAFLLRDQQLRPFLLTELLQLELELRRESGEDPAPSDYVERFSQYSSLIKEVFRDLRDPQITQTQRNTIQAGGRGLHVRCPHCHNPIELVPDAELESFHCPSCGSEFSLLNDGEATRHAEPVSNVDHFRLVERLGMGAFGSVWKAHDRKLDRTVAVKIPRHGQFDEIQEKAFLREAQNAAQLSHPGIVPVFEVGRDGDTLYIVSEFVRGLTLTDRLRGQSPSTSEAVELCIKICEALQHAHDRGVIHRDIKPSNIMLDASGAPHLMDFGLARRDAAEITMTVHGQVLGTPAYMSPEQARGESHKADARSDIYSVGVILFQLLTGELPFRGNTRMLLHQVIHDEAPSPRKLNSMVARDLETICEKCLRKEPGRRYQSSAEIAEDLQCWLENKPIKARPISTAERIWKWSAQNIAILAGLYAIVEALMTTATAPTLLADYFQVESAALIPTFLLPVLIGIFTLRGNKYAPNMGIAWYSVKICYWLLAIASVQLASRGSTIETVDSITHLLSAFLGVTLFGRLLFFATPQQSSLTPDLVTGFIHVLGSAVVGGSVIVSAFFVYGFFLFALEAGTAFSSIEDIDHSPDQVREGAPEGTPVGIVAHIASRSMQSFRLKDDAGGRFTIDSMSGEVRVSDPSKVDFESKNTHWIVIETADGENAGMFTIDVQNAGPTPPVDIDDSPNQIPFDAKEGMYVGIRVESNEPNGPTEHLFLSNDAQGLFKLESDSTIRIARDASFDGPETFFVVVQANVGLWDNSSSIFKIDVADVVSPVELKKSGQDNRTAVAGTNLRDELADRFVFYLFYPATLVSLLTIYLLLALCGFQFIHGRATGVWTFALTLPLEFCFGLALAIFLLAWPDDLNFLLWLWAGLGIQFVCLFPFWAPFAAVIASRWLRSNAKAGIASTFSYFVLRAVGWLSIVLSALGVVCALVSLGVFIAD